MALPCVGAVVNGRPVRALVDTGCTKSMVSVSVSGVRGHRCEVTTFDGGRVGCLGGAKVSLEVGGRRLSVECIVAERLLDGISAILGMDVIDRLGGVCVSGKKVAFGCRQSSELVCEPPSVAAVSLETQERATPQHVGAAEVEREDFRAVFDPQEETWTVSWKWISGYEPDGLKNGIAEYRVPDSVRAEYEAEVQRWIHEGWLRLYDEERLGPAKGLIPLLAVVQEHKGKTRPVQDFRELNGLVDARTADADVCADRLREWRRQGANTALLDLSSAYLQIHVDESLWSFQTVMFRGHRYCLTRLGFGLNVAPLVMKAILTYVLGQDEEVKQGASAYVDDIYINEDIVAVRRVRDHLARFGLQCKPHERVAEGARVLGLRVWGERDGVAGRTNRLMWARANDLPDEPPNLTRRSLFSFGGKLISHLPVCGWLRPAVAYIKRRANAGSEGWDDVISDQALRVMLNEISSRLREHDPARGRWDVSGYEATVWVDASSLAIGVVLEVAGQTVEDACWLRPDDDSHINMAELDALVRGMNMAISWKMRKIHFCTDSATVFHWISDALSGRARLKTKAASEMLIRRRVGVFKALVDEYSLEVDVRLVPSEENIADGLTRVPQKWLKAITATVGVSQAHGEGCMVAVQDAGSDAVTHVHERTGHQGVERTLFFARLKNPGVTRGEVQEVVSKCQICHSIDPAPVRWKRGHLSVAEVWSRVAMDVTHFRGRHYLTLIDCGPSRFAIWRELSRHSAEDVCRVLESVFTERGGPAELLTDNDTAFRSAACQKLLSRWGVTAIFRCAYAPSGNGIVERSHRQIKRTAARSGCSIAEAVYWHNITPKDNISTQSAPANLLHRYSMRVLGIDEAKPCREDSEGLNRFSVGQRVWVRPDGARCDSPYGTGTVTKVLSEQAVEVDGMPRHVRDLRPAEDVSPTTEPQSPISKPVWPLFDALPAPESDSDSEEGTSDEEAESGGRRSQRPRVAPDRYGVVPWIHK